MKKMIVCGNNFPHKETYIELCPIRNHSREVFSFNSTPME